MQSHNPLVKTTGEMTLSDTEVITIVHLEENAKLEVCQKTC